MSEIINNRKVFSLLEVTKSIEKTIADRYKSSYWIKAEMNNLNHYSHSGHCYPDLVEKENGQIIAQVRAILWKNDYQNINASFIQVLKEPLKDGIKILISAKIGFHPKYGLSLRIIDIDPSFTLGDLEKEKQETIKKLQLEGIFDTNKKLQIPLLPQRIAIISVETSKGYADFLDVLESANKSWNYKFFHILFPSLLQGDKAIKNIINQLRKIRMVSHHFDVVAILRGGGGDVGLSCYNHYDLAKEIALFPIPIITGIGHATNLTVTEMVSFKNEITPTKLAEYLIQKFHNFSVPIQKAQEKIIDKAKRLIQEEKTKFNSEIKLFRSVVSNILISKRRNVTDSVRSLSQNLKFRVSKENESIGYHLETIRRNSMNLLSLEKNSLTLISSELNRNIKTELKNENLILNNFEKNIEFLNPQNILKRGFSITLLNGKSLKNYIDVNINDTINTILHKGELKSKIIISKENKDGK